MMRNPMKMGVRDGEKWFSPPYAALRARRALARRLDSPPPGTLPSVVGATVDFHARPAWAILGFVAINAG